METGSGDAGRGRDVRRPWFEQLDDAECWRLLDDARFGRLAVAAAGELDIYPLDFAVDGTDVVFRTAEGTKLVEVVLTDLVALEADHRDVATGQAWSVVVKGTPRLLERFDEIYAAQSLGIRPWVAAPRERFVRITRTRISGRRFSRGSPDEQPE